MAKARNKAPSPAGSLLSPASMGGLIAGKGFDFQTRFAACHLPSWLRKPTFHQIFYEGTGDIDLRFVEDGVSSRVHMQVKDHEVAPAEFKEVVGHFRKLDQSDPKIYSQFTLVCPSLSPKLQPCESGVARWRNAIPFYDDAPSGLAPTKDELEARLRKVGLDDGGVEFVCSKLAFDVGYGDFHHDDRAENFFIGSLLRHPDYAGRIRAMVQPAFAEVLRAIHANQGVVLDRSFVEGALRDAVAAASTPEKSITVWVQNWTHETFDLPPDYSLDWSSHFDRDSRRVPASEVWNAQLLPELRAVKDKIVAERPERVIRFRGKSALSTGLALGATFPTVGGWTFQIPQPPAKEEWRSDATPTTPFSLQVQVTDGASAGADLVLGLNIRGDGEDDVRRYVARTSEEPRLFAFMAPSSVGGRSISGAPEACAFAVDVREHLGDLLKRHRLTRTRLFFYGPFALAVFLGQQLTSLGEIQLFEYQDPGYVPSCSLRT